MQRFGFLIVLAAQSLRAHKLKTFVIALIVALGSFVMVVGLSFVRSTTNGMRVATSEALTGHIQVWSSEAPDEIRLLSIGADEPDIGTIEDFSAAEKKLLEVAGVTAAVPMSTGGAFSTVPSDMERALEQLRAAVNSGDVQTIAVAQEIVRSLTRSIVDGAKQERSVASAPEQWDARIETGERLLSQEFWDDFAADPRGRLMDLEIDLVPIAPAGRTLYFNLVGTDPVQYREQFSRLRLVDGEFIPAGRRGLMMPKRLYEGRMKHPMALALDKIKDDVALRGVQISGDDAQKSRLSALAMRAPKLAAQFDASRTQAIRTALRTEIKLQDGELAEVLRQFIAGIDESNVERRHKFFYDTIAPAMRLYAHTPGDDLVLRGFTANGYVRAVTVKFYGTYEFEGLEEASIASVTDIVDLVTSRELYGRMNQEQLDELSEIKASVGVKSMSRDSVEDALFGSSEDTIDAPELEEPNPEDGEVEPTPPSFEVPEVFNAASGLEDRVYTRDEMREGFVTNIAVFVDGPETIGDTIVAINALDGLQATDWKTASGLIGQVIDVLSGILWSAVLFIFLIALVVLNNSTLMATMDRVTEIGTLRALGAQRRDVLFMVFVESGLTAIIGGVAGVAAGAAFVLWLGSVGIPAPAPEMRIFFGGERLFVSLAPMDIFTALALAVVVTLLSALHPARLATRVPPVVAMRGKS